MDLSAIGEGFAAAMTLSNLGWVLVGVLLGTVIGVLPGLGPTATIALLLPITFNMDPTSAIIMLAGIYYGSMYGGTITAVLLKVPGEAANIVTSIDGHEMAKRGRAGVALSSAAISSFVGGTVSTLSLFFLAPLFATVAVQFGPPEFAVIAACGILLTCYIGSKSVARALISASLGLFFATIGRDPISGEGRFTLDNINLSGGLDLVAVAMGVFGLGELIFSVTQTEKAQKVGEKVKAVLPDRHDFRRIIGPIGRGSVLGALIGLMPGGGGVVSSMASYALEKKVSRSKSEFGKGALEGVAGPESANNASATTAFIPLLTLGLPSNVVMAVIFGALLIQGITPGPTLIAEQPAMFWGVIASMLIGNLMLLVLNIPMVGVFVRLLKVRAGLLASFAVVITAIGAFSLSNSLFDMWVLLAFGLIGYIMRLVGLEPAPMVLAFVLAPILEQAVRQSLLVSNGNPMVFVSRPISGGIIFVVAAAFLVTSILRARKRKAIRMNRIPELATHDREGWE